MNSCIQCGSYAINHHLHGRDGSDPELCDVCYWRKRAQAAYQQEGRGDLIKRLLAHAMIHERHIPQDEEQRQWASDLREAARMLATHPSAGPEVLATGWYHHRPGEDGEPDDYDIYDSAAFPSGKPPCPECIPIKIVRADHPSPADEAVRRDADRYRWLRDRSGYHGLCAVRIYYWSDEYSDQAGCDVFHGAHLDQEIDAAIDHARRARGGG